MRQRTEPPGVGRRVEQRFVDPRQESARRPDDHRCEMPQAPRRSASRRRQPPRRFAEVRPVRGNRTNGVRARRIVAVRRRRPLETEQRRAERRRRRERDCTRAQSQGPRRSHSRSRPDGGSCRSPRSRRRSPPPGREPPSGSRASTERPTWSGSGEHVRRATSDVARPATSGGRPFELRGASPGAPGRAPAPPPRRRIRRSSAQVRRRRERPVERGARYGDGRGRGRCGHGRDPSAAVRCVVVGRIEHDDDAGVTVDGESTAVERPTRTLDVEHRRNSEFSSEDRRVRERPTSIDDDGPCLAGTTETTRRRSPRRRGSTLARIAAGSDTTVAVAGVAAGARRPPVEAATLREVGPARARGRRRTPAGGVALPRSGAANAAPRPACSVDAGARRTRTGSRRIVMQLDVGRIIEDAALRQPARPARAWFVAPRRPDGAARPSWPLADGAA